MVIFDSFGIDWYCLNIIMVVECIGMICVVVWCYLFIFEYLGYLEFDGYYFYLIFKIFKFLGFYLGGVYFFKIF